MAQVTSIVMKLDNGTFRSLDFARVRSAYIQGEPPSNATIHQTGTGGLVSAPTSQPDWDWPSRSEPAESDGDNGPICYWIDGVWVCD